MRIPAFFLCLLLVAGASAPPASRHLDLTGYKLTFDDEFNTFSASAKGEGRTWQTRFFWGDRFLAANGERQYYADAGTGRIPFALRDGALEITAAPDDNAAGQPYISGMISSYPSFSQSYGYFEIRAKLPRGQGMWPAFWLLPRDGGGGEIDVMEAFGAPNGKGEGGPDHIHWALHWTNIDPGAWVTIPLDIHEGYHSYGVDWEPEITAWYVDSREIARVATPVVARRPMYLIANLAVGGHWPGAPAGDIARLSIDYIRAFSKAPNAKAIALQPISSPDGVDTTPTAATFLRASSPTNAPRTQN